MKISLEKPPIFEEASKLFGVTESDIIWFTWGDTIFAPCKKMPPDFILVHEETHAEQQGHSEEGAKLWWERFFSDPDFRAAQEAEAYGMQFKWMRAQKQYRDRNVQAKILHEIASNLSGKIYGKCVNYQDAKKIVRAYADGTAMQDIEKYIPDVAAQEL